MAVVIDRECIVWIKRLSMESEVVVYAEILYFRRHVCEEGSSEIDCKVTGNL